MDGWRPDSPAATSEPSREKTTAESGLLFVDERNCVWRLRRGE
jgi:hypothetical protein